MEVDIEALIEAVEEKDPKNTGELQPLSTNERIAIAAGMSITGASIEDIAAEFSVSTRAVYMWMRDARWDSAITVLRRGILNELRGEALNTLRDALRTKDAQTARWLLERIDPAIFGSQKDRVTISAGTEAGPVVVKVVMGSEE